MNANQNLDWHNEWLQQLAPAHAPPPPDAWPPAPGWWGLALLLLAAIAALRYWLNRPPRRLRRTALRQLTRLERSGLDDTQFARDLQDLLRRYAVARYGRPTVAGLAGSAWIDFVVAHGGTELAGTAGKTLLRAAYAGRSTMESSAAPTGERTHWLTGARGFIGARK